MNRLGISVAGMRRLCFDDGRPVRAASAIARLGDGWLVVQDDGAHAAWWRASSVTGIRLFPAVDGHDDFSSAAGTKHLKPDVESVCEVLVDGRPGVLVLGSGSSARRMRGAVVTVGGDVVQVREGDLSSLYAAAAEALGVGRDELNFEGACCVGEAVRWFNRGNAVLGVPSSSIDVPTAELLAALGSGPKPAWELVGRTTYDLGVIDDVGLAITDAVTLPDGRLLVSAAAEDTPNMVDDGPVVGAALALIDGDRLVAVGRVPLVDGAVAKVEGLAVDSVRGRRLEVLAVVDDDADSPSLALDLVVELPPPEGRPSERRPRRA